MHPADLIRFGTKYPKQQWARHSFLPSRIFQVRIYIKSQLMPLAIALLNQAGGIKVDIQSFEHLKFDACCFSNRLLAELKQTAAGTVRIENDHIIPGRISPFPGAARAMAPSISGTSFGFIRG